MGIRKCQQCGQELDDNIEVCPNCGEKINHEEITKEEIQPVEIETKKEDEVNIIEPPIEKKSKSKKIIAIGIIAFIILLGAGGFAFKNYSDTQAKKAYNDYIELLTSTQESILYSTAKAEEFCILTSKVWNNAIWHKYDTATDPYTLDGTVFKDFNGAITALNSADSSIKTLVTLDTEKTLIDGQMTKLQDYPKDLEKCYNGILDLYTSYSSAIDFTKYPSGSLSAYNSNKTTKFQKVVDDYSRLSALIPEQKK